MPKSHSRNFFKAQLVPVPPAHPKCKRVMPGIHQLNPSFNRSFTFMHMNIMKTALRNWFKSSLTWVPGSTQVIKFGNKHLYLLSCLTGSKSILTGLSSIPELANIPFCKSEPVCQWSEQRKLPQREGFRVLRSVQAYSDPVSRSRNKNKPHTSQWKAATES